MYQMWAAMPLTAIGLVFSTTFATINLTLNNIAIPSLLISPDPAPSSNGSKDSSSPLASTAVILKQWSLIQRCGHYVGPPTAKLSATTYLGASFLHTSLAAKALWGTAAVLAISVVPFTVFWILEVNDELKERSKSPAQLHSTADDSRRDHPDIIPQLSDPGTVSDVSVAELGNLTLLAYWIGLNEIRAGLMVTATLLALVSVPLSVRL